jgi:hypothetical protein
MEALAIAVLVLMLCCIKFVSAGTWAQPQTFNFTTTVSLMVWVWRLTARLVCNKICFSMLGDIESSSQAHTLGIGLHGILVSDQCRRNTACECGAVVPSLEVYCYALAASWLQLIPCSYFTSSTI